VILIPTAALNLQLLQFELSLSLQDFNTHVQYQNARNPQIQVIAWVGESDNGRAVRTRARSLPPSLPQQQKK
jgi:hypothetical protein